MSDSFSILQLGLSAASAIASTTLGIVVIGGNKSRAQLQSSVNALNLAEEHRREDAAAAEVRRREDIAAIKASAAAEATTLSNEKHDLTVKLLDERDRRISHTMNNIAQQAANAIQLQKEHAVVTERRFETITSALPKLEVELVKTLSAAREFVHESAASRIDFDRFCEQSTTERREINDAITQLERKVVTTEDLKDVLRDLMEGRK